jgi:hypothetical protein
VIRKVLLAIDDSPAALASTRAAVDLAAACGADLRAVTVVVDHEVSALLPAGTDSTPVHARRQRAADAVLRAAAQMARRRAVSIVTAARWTASRRRRSSTRPAPGERTSSWSGGRPPGRPGDPAIGCQTRHVLEFADIPVLVVPPGPA